MMSCHPIAQPMARRFRSQVGSSPLARALLAGANIAKRYMDSSGDIARCVVTSRRPGGLRLKVEIHGFAS